MTIRVTGHFGEWMQGRLGPDGPIVLVTIPCAALHVEAKRCGDGPLAFAQTPELLTFERARAFLDRIYGQEAHYRLHANMPLGGGAGASTAALLALARAAGGDEAKLIDACITTEGASDPLMLPHPDRVLWASREGRVVREMPSLPRAEVIGGFPRTALVGADCINQRTGRGSGYRDQAAVNVFEECATDADNAGRWSDACDGGSGVLRTGKEFPERSRLCGMAGSRSSPAFDRWQGAAGTRNKDGPERRQAIADHRGDVRHQCDRTTKALC